MGLKGALFFVPLLFAAASAAADQADPVDDALQACLARPAAGSTAGMEQCFDAAILAYDKQLNTTYGRVMAALDPKSKELLRSAQRAWLAFRTAEHAATAGPFAADRGTQMRIEVLSAEADAIKQREQALHIYLPPDG